jgi:alcohol dehydrogenase class IV
LGVCHAVAHQIGARCKAPHGVANDLILPEVIQFNLQVLQDSLKEIGCAFNVGTEHLDDKEAALRGIQAVRELTASVSLPTRLQQVGAISDDFPAMANQALEDPTQKPIHARLIIRCDPNS